METKEMMEISDYFDQDRFDELKAFINSSKETIVQSWLNNDYVRLENQLDLVQALLQFYRESLEDRKEDQMIMELGVLLGTAESFRKLLYEFDQDKRHYTSHVKGKNYSKYLQEVLFLLATHGSMTHSELCDHLAIQKSTLSEAMKSILSTGFVEFHYAGKFKVYSLSDAGIRYERKLRKNKADLT